MGVELGHFALIVALLLAVAQAGFGLVGAAVGSSRHMAVARPAVAGQWVFVAVAFAVLAWAFQRNDFSVLYVAQNSNSALPAFYRFAAVWGAHEGSLVLWALALATWSLAVAAFSRQLPESFAARVLGVLGVVSAGFLLFILLTSNPFERLTPAATDGRDLNPVLQDFALAVHPPMLYIGYVGFSVAFAFAVAAMLEGRLDARWARWTRPWTTLAWLFLTIGIALGSWWAYYELGWGGWWFWDPVENASFMPWLVGTALIHSLAVTEKRGLFRSWTLLLSILAFSLSLLGTFLVRSGVLISVHAFASDPGRGIFILTFLGLCIGGSLALYAWRGPALRTRGGFEAVSRESFLMFNNVLLMVATGLILIGTLYPLFLETLGLGKISVGPPYFNKVFIVPMLPLLALLAIGMHAGWKKARLEPLKRPLTLIALIAVAAALVVPALAWGSFHWLTVVGVAAAGLVILSALYEPFDRLRHRQRIPASVLGMCRRAPRCRPVHARRNGDADLPHREGHRALAGRALRAARLHLRVREHAAGAGPELPGDRSRGPRAPRRAARDGAAPAEARVPRAAEPDDRGGHRGRMEPRPVRRDGRGSRRWRVEPAPAVQADGALHLARRAGHGPRWPRGRHRPALPLAAGRSRRTRARRRHGDRGLTGQIRCGATHCRWRCSCCSPSRFASGSSATRPWCPRR